MDKLSRKIIIKNQRGVILVTTLFILVFVTALALTTMSNTGIQALMARNAIDRVLAFHMADAALSDAETLLDTIEPTSTTFPLSVPGSAEFLFICVDTDCRQGDPDPAGDPEYDLLDSNISAPDHILCRNGYCRITCPDGDNNVDICAMYNEEREPWDLISWVDSTGAPTNEVMPYGQWLDDPDDPDDDDDDVDLSSMEVGGKTVQTVVREPVYIIEALRCLDTQSTFRITAMGWGRNEFTNIRLQSIYIQPGFPC